MFLLKLVLRKLIASIYIHLFLYKNMNLIGALSANEIRSLEDMNAYEGGDEYFVQANMQTIENAKYIKTEKNEHQKTE